MNRPTNPPCKAGDRIELIAMPNDPAPIPAGTRGTVVMAPTWFQNNWQICVKWEVKRSLNLCSPPDLFRVLPKEEHDQMAKEPLL